jgi:N-acetyltransferase 10
MWTGAFQADFASRFLALLPAHFRDMEPAVVLSLLQPQLTFSHKDQEDATAQGALVNKVDGQPLNGYDLKRLQVCSVGNFVSRCFQFERCYMIDI